MPTLIRGKRMRLTRLDECCAPLAPAAECAFTVTKGFISVTLSPEFEDGDEFVDKNADGDLCINEMEPGELKRYTASIEMCGVDFSVVEIATNSRMETDSEGNVVGVRSVAGRSTENFALELWLGVGGQACAADGSREYGYIVLPCLSGGQIAELTVENGPINVTIEQAFTRAGTGWDVGPYDVIDTLGDGEAGPLATPMAVDEPMLNRITTIAPPDVTDGCQPMPA